MKKRSVINTGALIAVSYVIISILIGYTYDYGIRVTATTTFLGFAAIALMTVILAKSSDEEGDEEEYDDFDDDFVEVDDEGESKPLEPPKEE